MLSCAETTTSIQYLRKNNLTVRISIHTQIMRTNGNDQFMKRCFLFCLLLFIQQEKGKSFKGTYPVVNLNECMFYNCDCE